jgi:rhodanese-related sulfurtransferase
MGKMALAAVALACFAVSQAAEPSAPHTNGVPVKHVTASEARQLAAKGRLAVLDLRTPREFAGGRIAVATNINFQAADFETAIARLDRSKPCLIYCAVGGRSTAALPAFHKLGFQSVYHLDGGLKGWAKAGLPLEK